MGWRLDEYLEQPDWFIDELIRQINKERRDAERAFQKTA